MNLVVFGEFDGSCPELCSITAPRGRIELEAAGTRLRVGFARTRLVLPFLKIWKKVSLNRSAGQSVKLPAFGRRFLVTSDRLLFVRPSHFSVGSTSATTTL